MRYLIRTLILMASLWLVTSPLWGKIVFHSNRDGNWEIYTMNSHGTNQTRLTFNEVGDGYLHQVHFEDTGQSTTVTIHLDALTH